MGRKSQAKHNNKEKPDKDKLRRLRQLLTLSERILRVTGMIPYFDSVVNSWDRHETMASVVEEVMALELADAGHKKPPVRSRSEGLAAFVAWLKENGAEFEGVEISEFPGYDLGLRAMRDFAQSNLVLTVPRRLMLTEEEARKSAVAEFFESDSLVRSMPNVALALFLLLEKFNPESFWKPYLDILPESYATVLFFTNEELLDLKPSPVFEQSLKLCRGIARQYAYLYSKIHSDAPGTGPFVDIFTYERYRWAASTVMTRQNNVAGATAFIPLWDICNHEHGRISTEYNPELSRGECYALRNFTAGDQILIFYGVRTNADLFLHNGFVYPDNLQDSTTISLGISSSDVLRDSRLALLGKLGLAGVTQYALHSVPVEANVAKCEGQKVAQRTPLSPELLAFVRIFSMNADELTKWLSSTDFSELVSDEQASVMLVGAVLERRAFSYLQTRCRLMVQMYAKHAEKRTQDDGAHGKNIKLLKEIEVRILTQAIDHCSNVLEQLPKDETPPEEQCKRIDELVMGDMVQ